jgi:hypothetical protein
MHKLILFAVLLLAACSSSNPPAPQPAAVAPAAEQAKPKTEPASQPVEKPKAAPTQQETHAPAAAADEKAAAKGDTSPPPGTMTVHPVDPKNPLHCPADVKDHCEERPDGSIVVHDGMAPPPQKPGDH